MSFSIQVPQGDGAVRTLYDLGPERTARLPLYLIIAAPQALRILDDLSNNFDLPTIDVDAVLAVAIDGMTRCLSHSDREVAVEVALERVFTDNWESFAGSLRDGFVSRDHLELNLRLAFGALNAELLKHQLYQSESVLLYDYQQRRGKDAIVLKRKQYFAFD